MLHTQRSFQDGLFPDERLACAVEQLASAGGIEARGAVFTRPEVVEFILDVAGYTPEQPLYQRRLLEPSFGGGDFLIAAVARLLTAYRASGRENYEADLGGAICGVELHHETFEATGGRLEAMLVDAGLPADAAYGLRHAWLRQGDFLLTDFAGQFDHVVGNPPYVRQELIPEALIREYRQRYRTVYDRADLYVPFFERSLQLLNEGGVLGFICADRWMKNRYGGPLRRLIADEYHLRAFVDMVDTPAFLSDVIAYPGIFVIANEKGTVTRVASRPEIERQALSELAAALTTNAVHPAVRHSGVVAHGDEPWLVNQTPTSALIRRLEAEFPLLEETGCKVGIGVATGADSAFIGPLADLDVEDDRKLPLVMTRDILNGHIEWRGFGVVNPFADEGGLVDLDRYPRLKRYLEARKDQIAKRHVAKKAPENWYRTIDRIYPALVAEPKLLVPDIKGAAHVVYDEGAYYPHHNLYFITSAAWDIRALQAVLLSKLARTFVATYSTKMRGGYLRFQAQYLRRIRLPLWDTVPNDVRSALAAAAATRDEAQCDDAVAALYGLTPAEAKAMATAQ